MLINRNAGVSKNNPHLKNEAPENSEAPVFYQMEKAVLRGCPNYERSVVFHIISQFSAFEILIIPGNVLTIAE